MNRELKQNIGAIVACFLWSTAFFAIKRGIEYTTPVFFAGLRFTLAGVLTLLFMKNRSSLSHLKSEWRIVLKVAFAQTFLLYFLFYMGLHRITGSLGAVITGFSPLWAVVLSHFLMSNDRLTLSKLTSFLLGVAGITIVTIGQKGPVTDVNWVGLLLMLGSSLSSGFAAIFVAKDKGKLPAIPLNGAQLLIGGVALTLLSLGIEDVSIPREPQFWGWLLYLSVLSAVAFSIWFSLLKEGAQISALNVWKFIIPVSGAILSWIFLPGESPTAMALVGIVLVGSGILNYYRGKR